MGPCEVKVCRICFTTNCQLYFLHENMNLYMGYEDVTGLLLADEEDLPSYLCTECADQLMNCARFRHRSLHAHTMLLDILKNHDCISLELIQAFTAQTKKYSDIELRKKEMFTEHRNDKDGKNMMVLKLHNSLNIESENVTMDTNELENDVNIDCTTTIDIKKEIEDVTESEDIISDNRKVIIEINTVSPNSTKDIKTEFTDVKLECEDALDNPEVDDVNTECGDGTIDDRTEYINVKTEAEDRIDKIRKIVDVNLKYGTRDGNNTGLNNVNKKNDFTANHNMVGSFNRNINNVSYVMGINGDVFVEEAVNDYMDDSKLRTGEDVSLDDGILSGQEDDLKRAGAIEEREENLLQERKVMEDVDKLLLSGDYSCEIHSNDSYRQIQFVSNLKARTKTKLFYCDKCDFKSKFKKFLVAHFVIHSGQKPYTCIFCQKKYLYERSLINHLELHNAEKSLTCKICSKEFCQRGGFRRHMRIHTGDKPLPCDVCKQSFDEKCHCESHQPSNTVIRPYSCNICNKSFTRNFHFKNHLLIHSGEKPHTCPVCKKSFRIKSKLKAHMRRHSGEEPYLQSHIPNANDGKDKPYKCDVCQNSFRRKNHCRMHMLIHTGEKPYTCSVCNKSFRRNSHLRRHLQTHSGRTVDLRALDASNSNSNSFIA